MKIKGLDRTKQPIEVEIENGIIKNVKKIKTNEKLEQYIIPGFIDIHTHGGYGTDFADCSEDSTRKYLRELPKEGTTSMVHATITTEYDNLLNSIEVADKVMKNPKEDEITYLGVNIEGNFLNRAKKGAHKEELLVPLELKHVDDLSKTGAVKMISAAYENAKEGVIEKLIELNIIPSLAHSIATGEETEEFVNKGLKGITHMFNAMTAFNHRGDSLVNRALVDDRISTELICDGVHVHKEIVKLLYKIKPIEKILIITDSAPLKGMPDGASCYFGELEIYKKDGIVRTKLDDALGGSSADMHSCFKNFINFTGCSLEEASIATSTNQANYLGIDNMGDIKKGYQADILVLDNNLDIVKTISKGNILYERK